MADLGPVPWPPAAITTKRLVMRRAEARDRATVIELHASPEVYAYLGGPRPRDELEQAVPMVPGQRPGYFVADLDGAAIGTVAVSRRDAGRPVHREAVELSYLFLPSVWGRGFAVEACQAVLGWLTTVLPDEDVVLCTQTANAPSMRLAERLGFTEVDRFVEFGAEQWFGVWRPSARR